MLKQPLTMEIHPLWVEILKHQEVTMHSLLILKTQKRKKVRPITILAIHT